MAKSTSSRRNQTKSKSPSRKSTGIGSTLKSRRKTPLKPRSSGVKEVNTPKSSWQQVFKDMQAALGISAGRTDKKQAKPKTVKTPHLTVKEAIIEPQPKKIRGAKAKTVGTAKASLRDRIAYLLNKFRYSKRQVLFMCLGIVILGLAFRFQENLFQLKEDIFAPYPPSPNVVASFDGGQITIEDVQKHIATLTKDEEIQKQLKSPEGYRYIVSDMISDEVIRRFAKERKADQKKEITHVMQHITEEINISALHTEMHEGQMGVNESDIQAYYDANRKDFGEQTLTQARDQILSTLQSQKEDTFVKNYIEGLKNKASITRDDSLLAVPEPQDFEIKNYFDTNRDKYQGKQFEEVSSQVKDELRREKEKSYYKDSASRTLFTVNGKQYTLGQFGEEFQELPETFLAEYQGIVGKTQLVDRIIERLLLYEDSLSQVSQTETKEKKDEIQLKVMGQILEQEEIDDKIKITDEEIKKFYEDNKAEMIQPPQSKIRHIMVKSGETDDEKKKAQEKANAAYKKLVPGPLQKGADFASVAKEFSEDEETKNQGGEVKDWVSEKPDLLSELKDHELHQQILAVPKGGISPPIESGDAFYIIQVVDRGEPKQMSFEETKELIKDRLTEQKHDELAKKLSDDLQKKVNSTIYTRTLKTLVKS